MTETTCTWLEGWRKSNTHTNELEKAREALHAWIKSEEAEAIKAAEQDERWQEIEECLDSIALDVKHRCCTRHNVTGVRHIMMLVRRNLAQIELRLLEDDA